MTAVPWNYNGAQKNSCLVTSQPSQCRPWCITHVSMVTLVSLSLLHCQSCERTAHTIMYHSQFSRPHRSQNKRNAGLCIYCTTLLMVGAECTLSTSEKKVCRKTGAVLCQQQPRPSRVYHISWWHHFLMRLTAFRGVLKSNMLRMRIASERQAVPRSQGVCCPRVPVPWCSHSDDIAQRCISQNVPLSFSGTWLCMIYHKEVAILYDKFLHQCGNGEVPRSAVSTPATQESQWCKLLAQSEPLGRGRFSSKTVRENSSLPSLFVLFRPAIFIQ